MTFKPLTIIGTALALSAGAAPPPSEANSRARVPKWFATNATAAQAEADWHCKQCGKSARVTEVRTDVGGRVLFECA